MNVITWKIKYQITLYKKTIGSALNSMKSMKAKSIILTW